MTEDLDRCEERSDSSDAVELAKTAGKAAAAAVIATSLVGALSEPPRADLMSLPDPTPIVQQYVVEEDVIPDEDHEDDTRETFLQRLLRLLKYLLVALALLATIALGVLKGCAGVAGSALLPPADEEQEQQDQRPATAEDERGVAW